MSGPYLSLFTLQVSHTYYTGVCRDFALLVTAETAAAMRSGRLLVREVEGIIRVMYLSDGIGGPFVSAAGRTLRFGLQLLNPYFGNITQLATTFPARRLRYTNTANPEQLAAATSFTFVPEAFSHTLSQAGRPATVTLRDGAGTVLQTENVTADDGRTAVSFDLRGRPTGPLTLEEVFPGAAAVTTALYLDPELRQRDAAAVVEITVDEGFYDDPPAFQIAFQAREEVLSYYVVVDGYTTNEFNSLSVTDAGYTVEGRPQITFQKIPSTSFTAAEIPTSLLAPGGERVVLFRSQAALARRERGRGRIQLSKQQDVLMANLPQPGVERAKADLIIHLSKP